MLERAYHTPSALSGVVCGPTGLNLRRVAFALMYPLGRSNGFLNRLGSVCKKGLTEQALQRVFFGFPEFRQIPAVA